MRMATLADAMSHSAAGSPTRWRGWRRPTCVRREASHSDGRGVEAVMTDEGRRAWSRPRPRTSAACASTWSTSPIRADFAALGRIFDEVSDRLLEDKPADADIR